MIPPLSVIVVEIASIEWKSIASSGKDSLLEKLKPIIMSF